LKRIRWVDPILFFDRISLFFHHLRHGEHLGIIDRTDGYRVVDFPTQVEAIPNISDRPSADMSTSRLEIFTERYRPQR
jgi:hypothetical protein